MKKKALFFAVFALFVVGVYRWRNPPLQKPTAQQVQKALPNGAQTVFDGADKFVLYALDPHEMMKNQGHKTYFHEFGILNEATITDKETMNRLRESFYDGIAVDQDMMAACFSPRHGLRAVKNGETVDLLICFSCGQSRYFVGKDEVANASITKRPQNTFNQIFADAGLKLAP